MIFFTTVLVAFFAVAGVFVDASPLIPRGGGTPSSTGTNNGFYYSYYTDGGAQATYTNGAGGEYSLTWGTGGNIVGGKGWNPGSAR